MKLKATQGVSKDWKKSGSLCEQGAWKRASKIRSGAIDPSLIHRNIMSRVYIVQHEHELSEDNSDVKFIGVYESQQEAEQAIKRAMTRPGFSDYPDGFTISESELGRDHWLEGFVTWSPEDESK